MTAWFNKHSKKIVIAKYRRIIIKARKFISFCKRLDAWLAVDQLLVYRIAAEGDPPLTNANGTLINLADSRISSSVTDSKARIFVGINSFTSNSSSATFARKYIKRALWDIYTRFTLQTGKRTQLAAQAAFNKPVTMHNFWRCPTRWFF